MHLALIHSGLMAGITWDPFIRGVLIVIVAVVLLPGSVYLVLATDTGARLGFWNIQGRHEVDFVVESGRDCLAIEVKAASRWTERDLAGLRAFLERTPRCRAAIMAYNGEQAVRLGDKLWAVPLSRLLG